MGAAGQGWELFLTQDGSQRAGNGALWAGCLYWGGWKLVKVPKEPLWGLEGGCSVMFCLCFA